MSPNPTPAPDHGMSTAMSSDSSTSTAPSGSSAGTLDSLLSHTIGQEISNTTSPTLSPHTLESLAGYAPDQETLIGSLLNQPSSNPLFRRPENENWEKFWLATWKRPLNHLDGTVLVKRDSDHIDDSLIPGGVPTHCDSMLKPKILNNCWDIHCDKILVRSEYEEAEEFAVSTCGDVKMEYRALVITGQPGIGKSMFLLRTLLRRLALGLPTVLQLHPSWALLFHSGGVREFAQLDDWSAHAPLKPPPEHNPLSRIWALMDSKYLRTPAPIFADGLFVVQTASPHPGRQEWAGGDRINQFYMEPWSFSEVLQARYLIESNPASEKELWYLYAKYGASPMDLYLFAHAPHMYDELIMAKIDNLSSEGLTKLLQSAGSTTDSSHYLTTMRPSPTDRTKSERTIASSSIRRMLQDDPLGPLRRHDEEAL